MTQVTVWNEFRHERTDPNVMAAYPHGIHATLAEGLARTGLTVRTATLDEPEQGLPDTILDTTLAAVARGYGHPPFRLDAPGSRPGASQISCQAWNPPWSEFVDPAAAAATITFDGGAVVNYRGSWVSPAPRTSWSGEWHIECARGEIVWMSRDDPAPDHVSIRSLSLGKCKLSVQIGTANPAKHV